MEPNEIGSLIFTVLSMIFYAVVFIPQFVEIYKCKNSDGISIWAILLWCQADTLSLLGTIILQLHIGLVIIGWYHMLIGQMLLLYILKMQTKKNFKKTLFVCSFVFSNFLLSLFFQIYVINLTSLVAGQILGWLSSTLYIVGRLPQLYYNYKRQSVEGLSILLYVFSICGNLSYIASILIYSSSESNVLLNLPWIVLTVGTGILDICVIFQSKLYKKSNTNVNFTINNQMTQNQMTQNENNKNDLKFYEIV
jgi:uncharacterized protein with PQ loop repeat